MTARDLSIKLSTVMGYLPIKEIDEYPDHFKLLFYPPNYNYPVEIIRDTDTSLSLEQNIIEAICDYLDSPDDIYSEMINNLLKLSMEL